MYALIVTVAVDAAGDREQMLAGLENGVIPRVRQSPGAVAGHWLDPDSESRGMSVVLFETREQADAAAASVPEHPAPGVTRLSVEVRRRIAGF